MSAVELLQGFGLTNYMTEQSSTVAGTKRALVGEGGTLSSSLNNLTIRKPNVQSLREGALSKLPIQNPGSAYQRLHDPKFSNKVNHEKIDAQRPAPAIGHRSERSVVQAGLENHETSEVNDSSNVPLNSRPKRCCFEPLGAHDFGGQKIRAKAELMAATLANEPNWFYSSINKEATQTQSWVTELFSYLDNTTKLESIKRSTLILLQKELEQDVGSEFFSNLIGVLTPPEQEDYLLWLTYEFKSFADAQKNDALKIIFQLAYKDNMLPNICSVIPDTAKDTIWGLATQNLEQKFTLKDAVTLARILSHLPTEQRTNACQTLARIALDNNASGAVFESLMALKLSSGDSMFDEVNLFVIFSEEAEKIGNISDIESLLNKIVNPLKRIQAGLLAASLIKGVWTLEIKKVFQTLRLQVDSSELLLTSMTFFRFNDVIAPEISDPAASAWAAGQIKKYQKTHETTLQDAAKNLYQKVHSQLVKNESDFRIAVKRMPEIDDELVRLNASDSQSQVDIKKIKEKTQELNECKLFVKAHHMQRLQTEALLQVVNPVAHHELKALRLKASFREKFKAHYKNSADVDEPQTALDDKLMFGKIPHTFEAQKICVDKRIELFDRLSPANSKLGWQVLINDFFGKARGTPGEADMFAHLLTQVLTAEGKSKTDKGNVLQLLTEDSIRLKRQGVRLPLSSATVKQLMKIAKTVKNDFANDLEPLVSLISNVLSLNRISDVKDDDLQSHFEMRLELAKNKVNEFVSFGNEYRALEKSNEGRLLAIFKAMAAIYKVENSLQNYPAHLLLSIPFGLPNDKVSFDQVEPLINGIDATSF